MDSAGVSPKLGEPMAPTSQYPVMSLADLHPALFSLDTNHMNNSSAIPNLTPIPQQFRGQQFSPSASPSSPFPAYTGHQSPSVQSHKVSVANSEEDLTDATFDPALPSIDLQGPAEGPGEVRKRTIAFSSVTPVVHTYHRRSQSVSTPTPEPTPNADWFANTPANDYSSAMYAIPQYEGESGGVSRRASNMLTSAGTIDMILGAEEDDGGVSRRASNMHACAGTLDALLSDKTPNVSWNVGDESGGVSRCATNASLGAGAFNDLVDLMDVPDMCPDGGVSRSAVNLHLGAGTFDQLFEECAEPRPEESSGRGSEGDGMISSLEAGLHEVPVYVMSDVEDDMVSRCASNMTGCAGDFDSLIDHTTDVETQPDIMDGTKDYWDDKNDELGSAVNVSLHGGIPEKGRDSGVPDQTNLKLGQDDSKYQEAPSEVQDLKRYVSEAAAPRDLLPDVREVDLNVVSRNEAEVQHFASLPPSRVSAEQSANELEEQELIRHFSQHASIVRDGPVEVASSDASSGSLLRAGSLVPSNSLTNDEYAVVQETMQLQDFGEDANCVRHFSQVINPLDVLLPPAYVPSPDLSIGMLKQLQVPLAAIAPPNCSPDTLKLASIRTTNPSSPSSSSSSPTKVRRVKTFGVQLRVSPDRDEQQLSKTTPALKSALSIRTPRAAVPLVERAPSMEPNEELPHHLSCKTPHSKFAVFEDSADSPTTVSIPSPRPVSVSLLEERPANHSLEKTLSVRTPRTQYASFREQPISLSDTQSAQTTEPGLMKSLSIRAPRNQYAVFKAQPLTGDIKHTGCGKPSGGDTLGAYWSDNAQVKTFSE